MPRLLVHAFVCTLTCLAAVGAAVEEDTSDVTSLLQLPGARSLPPARRHAAAEKAPARRARSIPSAAINLDLPPEERWREFYSAHRDNIIGAIKPSDSVYEGTMLSKNVDFTRYEEWVGELRGIVNALNHSSITLDFLLDMELGYELGVTKGCTSFLAANSEGTVLHGRNLDLRNGAQLYSSVFDATFYRGGKPVFVATQLWFMVGLTTAYRLGRYSVAQNTRPGCGDLDINIAAAKRGAAPFTLLLRSLLQNVDNFADAVHELAETPVIAPQYFTLAGAGAWEGALISRDRQGNPAPYANVEVLSPQIGRWFIVQTNDDTWETALDERRPVALQKLSGMAAEMVNASSALDVMMTTPVLNNLTVFTWIVEPATGLQQVFFGLDELHGDVISAHASSLGI